MPKIEADLLTIKEVAVKMGVKPITVLRRIHTGKIKGIEIDKRWYVAPTEFERWLTGEAPKEEDAELATMKAETEKNNATASNATSKRLMDEELRLRDLPDVLEAKEEAIGVERRQLDSDIEACNRQSAKNRERAEQLDNKEGALEKALDDIKEWRKDIEKDLTKIRKYYQSLCSSCQERHLPKLSDFRLPDGVFTEEGKIGVNWEDQQGLFTEEEEEKEL